MLGIWIKPVDPKLKATRGRLVQVQVQVPGLGLVLILGGRGRICIVVGQEVTGWVLIPENLPAGIIFTPPLRLTTLLSSHYCCAPPQ